MPVIYGSSNRSILKTPTLLFLSLFKHISAHLYGIINGNQFGLFDVTLSVLGETTGSFLAAVLLQVTAGFMEAGKQNDLPHS